MMAVNVEQKQVKLLQFLMLDSDDGNSVLTDAVAFQESTSLQYHQPTSSSKAAAIACQYFIRDEHPRLQGFADLLLQKDELDFFSNLRLKKETFQHLLSIVEQRYSPSFRGGTYPVSPRTALLITLWYLGNKSTYREISEQFGLSRGAIHSTVQKIVSILCELAPMFIKWPTPEEILANETEFKDKSGFPGVVGALDGCHVEIKAPTEDQADYIDRTKTHSVNLMAVCDSGKIFIFIHAGFAGSAHDSRVFKSTELFDFIEKTPRALFPTSNYHLIGDSAFQLSSKYLLVPYKNFGNVTVTQQRYNTKLSQTRYLIENAFGMLKGRFRRLKYIDADVTKLPEIIKACCVLHNLALDFPEEEDALNIEEIEYLPDLQHDWMPLAEIHLPADLEATQKRDFIASLL